MSGTSPDEPLDARVGELLSADLDGAVSDEEHETARLWVERSAVARAERDGLSAVKAAVAALPQVEPPAGFFEAMLERGSPRPDDPSAPVVSLDDRRRRRGRVAVPAAAAAAAAAAWVAVAGGVDTVAPPVDEVEVALAGGAADVDVEVDRVDGGRVALVQQAGDVEWSSLPEGERGTEDGAHTWIDLTSDPGVARVVVTRGDELITLVSEDHDAERLIAVGVEQLPEDDGGLLGRIRRAFGG